VRMLHCGSDACGAHSHKLRHHWAGPGWNDPQKPCSRLIRQDFSSGPDTPQSAAAAGGIGSAHMWPLTSCVGFVLPMTDMVSYLLVVLQ